MMGSKRKDPAFEDEMKKRRFLVLFLLCGAFIATIFLYSNIYSNRRNENGVIIVNIGDGANFQKKVSVSSGHTSGNSVDNLTRVKHPAVLRGAAGDGEDAAGVENTVTEKVDDSPASDEEFRHPRAGVKIAVSGAASRDETRRERDNVVGDDMNESVTLANKATVASDVANSENRGIQIAHKLNSGEQYPEKGDISGKTTDTENNFSQVNGVEERENATETFSKDSDGRQGLEGKLEIREHTLMPKVRSHLDRDKSNILNMLTEKRRMPTGQVDLASDEDKSTRQKDENHVGRERIEDSSERAGEIESDRRMKSTQGSVVVTDDDGKNLRHDSRSQSFDTPRGDGADGSEIKAGHHEAAREFFDPSKYKDEIPERPTVASDEYEERRRMKEEMDKMNTKDEDTPKGLSAVSREFSETTKEDEVDKETPDEDQQPAPKWWDLLSEKEFMKFIDGLKNEKLRFGERIPKWLSRADVVRMEMLSVSTVTEVYHMDDHERLRLMIFNDGRSEQILDFDDCTEQCGAQKSVVDWYEIFAFHLDRVLGLNRALPSIARVIKARSDERIFRHDDRFTDGIPRPLIWWDPNIKHGGYLMNNQNSLDLSFTEYQEQLKYRCNSPYEKEHAKNHCISRIKLIEWSKLAIFDFLLQIHDRLDRNCCGYDVDEGELCMANGMHDDCDDVDKQFLVHIMTRKDDSSRLVFIDNAGHRKRSAEHLNFRLLQGMQKVPQEPIEVLKSGELRDMLRQSLQIDKLFMEAVGEDQGVNILIDIIETRGEILLDYIEEHNIEIVPDY